MAYAGEEAGLLGSGAIAQNFQASGVNVVGVLQLDMTNYKSPSADIAMITDFTNALQNQFVRDLAATYLPTLVVTNSVCGYACLIMLPGIIAVFRHLFLLRLQLVRITLSSIRQTIRLQILI